MEPITILSAELAQLNFHENIERTNSLRLELLNQGYSIVGVKLNNKQGFIISGKNQNRLIKLALKFNQEEFFSSDKNRITSKINCLAPKKKIVLGKLLKNTKCVKMNTSLTLSFTEDGTEHKFVTEL